MHVGSPALSTFGRYRLLERLGQGGMAEVFKAKSFGVEGFEKVLVIKRILPQLAKHPEFVDMFVHEAKLAVRLSHANIVQVFDLGIAEPGGAAGTPAYFMAMEYVHGFDLATLLGRCRRQQVTLPIDMCVYIAAEVAKGLDHAHRRRDEQLRPLGIVHRDVSPQNVLLSYEGEVKVTDFGIAKARGVLDADSEDTKTRALHGKFGYMSPEQARGEEVDARSDLFSLGVLLYECVAGVNPFSAPTTFETLRRVQACEYPPIELLRPDAPPELVAIVTTALAKTADARYADAGRMYEAMLAFLYAQGSRYGSHELTEFLTRFRTDDAAGAAAGTLPDRLAEAEAAAAAVATAERTPVEVPSRAGTTTPSSLSSIPAPSSAGVASGASMTQRTPSGTFFVGLEHAVGMGERRELTALVVEFPHRDSDSLAARAVEIVARYGGRVIRREPEHVAALFGLGEPDGRDTEVATRCALVLLRAMDAGSLENAPSAGIHTARIHVSQDGEPTEDERLLSLLATAREFARARAGKCAVSSAALRQLRGLFEVEPLLGAAGGDQPRTGLTGSIVKDVRSPQDAYGRFVGRKEDLRTLGEALASATKKRPRVLTVRGEHGIGKTRLLFEVERRLLRGPYNVGFYVASCPPRGRELPLSGIVAMLQVLCGVSESDAPERILAVQPRLRALGLHDEEVAAILGALGAPMPAASADATSALKHAFTRMVSGLCEDKPYAFAWDAAHCMDEDSLAIVGAAFQRLRQTRCVFVLAGRAGFSHPLEQHADHVVVELVDLKPEDAEKLVAARLGVDAVPPELLRFVRDRAGGHPQFIEEVLKALHDAQAVTVAERRVVTMRLLGQELALPKTLRGLVASRVARLAPADRGTLQAAAVLGDPVDAAVLAHMLGKPMSALEGSLAELKNRELLVHTGPSELRFTSPIVREVVVDALTHEAARQMHAACGASLEVVLGDKVAEQAARVATHFYEAGESDRAAAHFAKSGERRLEARQLEAAAKDYARAISVADLATLSASEVASWFASLTKAVRMVRACPDATEICNRALARLDETFDIGARVAVRVDAGVLLSALHRFDAARAQFESAERLAGDDEALAKKVLVAYTDLATRQGDFSGTLAMLERLQRIATVEGDRQEEHKVLLHRAQAHAGLGDRRAALGALASAEELLPDDGPAACERQKIRALVEYFARDFRVAVALAERAVDMARSLGVAYEVAINLHNLGDFLIHMEDFARAYGAIRQSIALCDEGGFERLASQNRMFLAFLDGAAGDAEAVELLRQGIRYAEAHDYTWDAVNGRYLLGVLLQRSGELAHARAELDKARVLARESGNRLVQGDCEAALRVLDAG